MSGEGPSAARSAGSADVEATGRSEVVGMGCPFVGKAPVGWLPLTLSAPRTSVLFTVFLFCSKRENLGGQVFIGGKSAPERIAGKRSCWATSEAGQRRCE